MTAKIRLKNLKDSDGWMELGNELGFTYNQISAIFQYGEYANIEIEVDDKLNIVSGRIIPFKEIPAPINDDES